MSKTKFYTGRGDRGDTARLAAEARVLKSDLLIDVIGTMDEATSAIGMARSLAQTPALKQRLPVVQRHLYRLMSHLSAEASAREQYAGLAEEDVSWLEDLIADLERDLPPLEGFVLPGDSVAGAACHVARTVVRRAERRLVALTDVESNIGEANLAYVNRLSSLMFVAALQEDQRAGESSRLAAHQSDR
ncbi:MAG: cob(I)yrinic acid a,c-diamide adenosyltransferase [Chloroflexi bacterium]|jgi:cob(I)alamin adenosyltransferase|nr:cob(I)yrinic acid a,c-diamide adenosyltransferase [Chloroflexota bacterium]